MNLEEGSDQIPDRMKGFILTQGFGGGSNLYSFGPVCLGRTSQVWKHVVEESHLHQCSPEALNL